LQHVEIGGVVRLEHVRAVQEGGQQIGVRLHTGVGAPHGRHTQIDQSWRRGPHQHQLALQAALRQAPFQHVTGGDIAKRTTGNVTRATVGHQRRQVGIDRQTDPALALAQQDALQHVVVQFRRRIDGLHVLYTRRHAQHRQGQRLVVAALELGQQRQGAHDPIGIGDGIEETRRRRCLSQHADIAAMALPGRSPQGLATQPIQGQRRFGQDATGLPVPVAREIVAQHHRPAL